MRIIGAFLLSSCVMLIMVERFYAQERTGVLVRSRYDSGTGFANCEDAMSRLDGLAIELQNQPNSRAYIFGYTGMHDPPGRILRQLKYAKLYLTSSRGIEAQRIATVNGGFREALIIESWIVPKGVSPPVASPEIIVQPATKAYEAWKFEENDFGLWKIGDQRIVISFSELCELEEPDYEEFLNILRREPKSRGHIIFYIGRRDRITEAREIMRILRTEVVGMGRDAGRLITVAYGGRRDNPTIEVWIVPEGAPTPGLSPAHHRRRRVAVEW